VIAARGKNKGLGPIFSGDLMRKTGRSNEWMKTEENYKPKEKPTIGFCKRRKDGKNHRPR
jgi:hypothetical protein